MYPQLVIVGQGKQTYFLAQFKNTFEDPKYVQHRKNLVRVTVTLKKTSNVRVSVTLRRVRITTVSVEKQWYFILWMCVCTLVFHHAHRMLRVIFSSEAWPYYLVNGTIFGIKLLSIKYVFWFSLQRLSETFLILRRTERGMIINVCWSSCKVPVILVRF
jgi:hypothetical protein